MLHKPRGFVTTMSDELGRRCVASLVEDVGERVYPIGRLDRNSRGLLLLTNDGEFANAVMHPSKARRESLQSYHKTGHIRRADSCYERRNDDRRQNDRSGAGDGARKARRQSGYRNSAFRGQKQADKKNVRGARNRGRTPQKRTAIAGVKLGMLPPGQVARADPAGGFAYTFGCRRKVEQKGEKEDKMLEFKPFDIDDKTHGYRAEENRENIGECIFSLDGTYAEILSVKTRDGDRLVAEGLVRSALNFAANRNAYMARANVGRVEKRTVYNSRF